MIIYKIENKKNGKIYIGKTCRKLPYRIAGHIRENKSIIQRALNKYGQEAFDISIIDKANSHEDLKVKERYWIKFYKCKSPHGYNLTDGGDGLVNPSKEVLDKLRQASLGKYPTEETRKKMSASGGNRRGATLSEESKQKIREKRLKYYSDPENKKKTSLATKKAMENPETKKRVALFSFPKGHVPHNKGIKLPEEWRKKLSESHKGQVAWNKGKKFIASIEKAA
jgi:group I intron endonuclease